tara:strand:+ start:669 stop:1145 length:477 start_codon:yes stop_codon:yes gene_type:complete
MNIKKELPLRIGVGIVLLNRENKVFVGKRIDNPENFWQMPQGGINLNENFLDAAKRELEEETNIKSVRLIKKINKWLIYDLPKELLGKIWNGKFRGQKQKWFIMKFVGKDNEIDINTQNPEFLEWKWIEFKKLPEIAVNFKKKIYSEIKKELLNLDLT